MPMASTTIDGWEIGRCQEDSRTRKRWPGQVSTSGLPKGSAHRLAVLPFPGLQLFGAGPSGRQAGCEAGPPPPLPPPT